MKGMQGRLPLFLGLIFLPLAVIAVGLLIASSSPGAPHLTDTGPVRIGGSTIPAQRPATPQFQPDPPATTSGGSRATRPSTGPTTRVRPPVQRRPAPAPAPYDADDDDSDDADDDDSDDADDDDDDDD